MIKFIENYDFEWPQTFNKKKIQRKVNKVIRKINEDIESDELWKGRFYVSQVKRSIKPFADMSGLDAYFLFEFHDRKTGVVEISHRWYSPNEIVLFHKVAWELNKFIVDYCKVWEENPRPSIDTSIDFRRNKS